MTRKIRTKAFHLFVNTKNYKFELLCFYLYPQHVKRKNYVIINPVVNILVTQINVCPLILYIFLNTCMPVYDYKSPIK